MENSTIQKYKFYLKRAFDFMVKHGYTCKPYPRIVLNDKVQEDDVFGRTGYYDPDNVKVVLFTNSRWFKDVMRSACHEFCHHKQNMEGRLGLGSYNGDRIVDDDALMKLEKEAYLNGNIAFRQWTETEKEN